MAPPNHVSSKALSVMYEPLLGPSPKERHQMSASAWLFLAGLYLFIGVVLDRLVNHSDIRVRAYRDAGMLPTVAWTTVVLWLPKLILAGVVRLAEALIRRLP